MISIPITSFNAGEFSPWMDGRVDLEKYSSGCRICENFLIQTYGGIRRRPGLQFVDTLRNESVAGRLLPFRFSTTDRYLLALNDGYLRVYTGGTIAGRLFNIDGFGNHEIAIPYGDDELFKIQFVQQNDVIYLCHPDHPVQKLIRLTSTTFEINPVDWEWAPMRPQNTDEDVKVSASATTGAVTLTGVGTAWTSGMSGSRMRIGHERPGADFETRLDLYGDSAATSDEILIQGGWQFTTFGDWKEGNVYVERFSESLNDWEAVRTYTDVLTSRNLSASGEEKELVRMRIRRDDGVTWPGTINLGDSVLEAVDGEPYGEVEITEVLSPTSASATVKHRLFSTDTTDLWSEGAFSTKHGHPRCAAFHEGRLVFGGTKTDRQTIWGSVSSTAGSYESFREDNSATDDSSYRHELAANEHNGIRWMLSERRLIIGTSGGEFVVGSADDSVVVTPANVRARRHSNFGSAEVQALFINDSVIYAQRSGRKMREYGYVFERDRYQASDITVLAEHVLGTGVVEMAFQQQRESVVWAVSSDGHLAALTYERDQSVIGWHRHTTQDGAFESVETIYGDGQEDEVWVIVNRVVDGSVRRFIERFDASQYEVMESDDRANWFYVDSGRTQTGAGLDRITNMDHLEGETVQLLADGSFVGTAVVSGGVALLPDGYSASKVTAGLPMVSRLEPMTITAGTQSGTSRNREGRINRVGMLLWHSLGGHIGPTAIGANTDDDDMDFIQYRDSGDPMDSSGPPITGEIEFDFDDEFRMDLTVGIVHDQPYPFALQMMVPKVEFQGS